MISPGRSPAAKCSVRKRHSLQIGDRVRQSREQLQLLFRSGVDAITSVTARFADDDWERPACGSWTARQTALHTVGVIDWYHEWLDRAIEGEHSRPFPPEEMDQRTEHDVERLADMSGPDAIQNFRTGALDYLERTTSHWDTTYAYPFGVVTTGLHCGVAATEWHLHAWDLATSSSTDYAPPDPESLLIVQDRASRPHEVDSVERSSNASSRSPPSAHPGRSSSNSPAGSSATRNCPQ